MTLSDCTKADLLWIIKRIEYHHLSNGKYAVERALGELALEKRHRRCDEADRIADAAHEKRQQYLALIEPYAGKKLSEIPLPVLRQCDELLKAARVLDTKWNKLIGVKHHSEGGKE